MTQTTTSAGPADQHARRIPLPTGPREPMKVNVFNFMTGASCQLLPLFPTTTPERGAVAARGVLPAIPRTASSAISFTTTPSKKLRSPSVPNNGLLQSGQIFVTNSCTV